MAGQRRRLLAITGTCVGLLVALGVPAVQGRVQPREATSAAAAAADACSGTHWVGAWAAAPQSSSLGKPDDNPLGAIDGPARTFEDQTVRIVTVPKIDGDALRVRLSNRFGTGAVTITAATVGVRAAGPAMLPGTVRPLTFGGDRAVTVPAGGEVVSDQLEGAVRAFEQLAVSAHVTGPSPLDFHQWAAGTNYVTPARSGSHVDDVAGTPFSEPISSSVLVTGVDVLAPRAVGAVVTLGDSITDGVGSTDDLDRRWPDELARILDGRLSVVNAGIGGNHVAVDGREMWTAVGPSAVNRFEIDVANVPAVTDVILFEGTNDLGNADRRIDTAANIIAGYRSIIAQARAAGLRVIGATITPADRRDWREDLRHQVNEWIRTSGELDAVLDFDAVVRDATDPSVVRAEYDAKFAHLTDAGYAALARSIDPDVFQGTGC